MTQRKVIGRSELVSFPSLGIAKVPSRIDTGAKTSAVWASDIHLVGDELHFKLFAPASPHFQGKTIVVKSFEKRPVTSSNGATEQRYVIKLTLLLDGRRIRASFSLADRSKQAYPVLVGRNILKGKFIVDVKLGQNLGNKTA